MVKMLEKILDKYYAGKAKKIMTQHLAILSIDKKWIKTKYGYNLFVKNRMYNDNFYKFVYEVHYRDAFERCLQWYNANTKDICDYVVGVLKND